MITDAREGASHDLSQRQVRYLTAMGFRTLCFVGMIFIGGWARWAMFGAAVILPYLAVLVANQANERKIAAQQIEHGEPQQAPELEDGRLPGEPGDLPGETTDEAPATHAGGVQR